jgi:hypothetical protein
MVLTDASEERIATIFRVEEKRSKHLLSLVPRSRIFLFSSTLKMEAMRSSESADYTIPTQRHIPEDRFLHSHRHENLKSYKGKLE